MFLVSCCWALVASQTNQLLALPKRCLIVVSHIKTLKRAQDICKEREPVFDRSWYASIVWFVQVCLRVCACFCALYPLYVCWLLNYINICQPKCLQSPVSTEQDFEENCSELIRDFSRGVSPLWFHQSDPSGWQSCCRGRRESIVSQWSRLNPLFDGFWVLPKDETKEKKGLELQT